MVSLRRFGTIGAASVAPSQWDAATPPVGWIAWTRKNLNFYRVHLLTFTIVPLVMSGIMYASNGTHHIEYIDCLFNCVSAMAVCGLATVNFSTLTGWQQAIIFLQMLVGSPVTVSLITIAVRRYYFEKKFQNVIDAARHQKLNRKRSQQGNFSSGGTKSRTTGKRTPPTGGFSTDMIRRVDAAPMLVNLSGHMGGVANERDGRRLRRDREDDREHGIAGSVGVSGGIIDNQILPDSKYRGESPVPIQPEESHYPSHRSRSIAFDPLQPLPDRTNLRAEHIKYFPRSHTIEIIEDDGEGHRSKSIAFDPDQESPAHHHIRQQQHPSFPLSHNLPAAADIPTPTAKYFPRTHTIEFAPDDDRGDHEHVPGSAGLSRRTNAAGAVGGGATGIPFDRTFTGRRSLAPVQSRGSLPNYGLPRTATGPSRSAKHSGFGGFPTPLEMVRSAVEYFFPKIQPTISRTLSRSFTVPRTATYASTNSNSRRSLSGDRDVKNAPYISFDAVVGRNSHFKDLTSDQLEELGGVEYRTLKILLWIIPCYYIGIQLFGFVTIYPYIKVGGHWNSVFSNQIGNEVTIGWFSVFQVVSAFSNTGMSLVDQSMLQFQTAYLMIFVLIFMILAGNTAYPVFLRFTIWVIAKVVPVTSRIYETCHFLLDHPRRCYLYLFPSHQTFFLFFIIIIMTLTDWVCFLILDIGTPAIESIPVGTRMADGLLQSAAVRAAGFGIVPLANLAPAVKVLYTIMMYISVYPIALSVRSTNVYEERSLGLFQDGDEEDEEDEDDFASTTNEGKSRMAVWSKYIAFHARRQLAFDIWWLGFALWLVCIIERGNINDSASASWFNIFDIIFELVSAYGGVGLSLGVPYDNYSFSGAFSVLSKLVVCIVMIRGRHRGLPVAIDRAVMLPMEFRQEDEAIASEDEMRRSIRRDSRSSFAVGRQNSTSFPLNIRKPSMTNSLRRSMDPDDGNKHNSVFYEDDDPTSPTSPRILHRRRKSSSDPVFEVLPPPTHKVPRSQTSPSGYPSLNGRRTGSGECEGEEEDEEQESSIEKSAGPSSSSVGDLDVTNKKEV